MRRVARCFRLRQLTDRRPVSRETSSLLMVYLADRGKETELIYRVRPQRRGVILRFSSTAQYGDDMPTITLSATPKGNGYQATVTFPDGVSISSEETYPTIAEAITAAAIKLLDLPERLATLDRTGA